MTDHQRRKMLAEDRKAQESYDALLAEVRAFDRGDHLRETPEDTRRIAEAAKRLRDWAEVMLVFLVVGAIVFGALKGTAHAQAPVWYVATTGSDQAAGTAAQPFRTLNYAMSRLSPGGTLRVRAGTYAEDVRWNLPSGTASAWVTIEAEMPAARPRLYPPSGTVHALHFQGQSYVRWSGWVIDASRAQFDGIKITQPETHHITVQDTEVHRAPGQGILTTDGAEFLTFERLAVHDNGTTDFAHGLYISTGNARIEDCEVYRNSGWGIHLYKEDSTTGVHDVVVTRNRVHDNARVGARGEGILVSSGPRNIATNNAVWNHPYGIVVQYGVSDALIAHNTVVNGRDGGIVVGSDAIRTTVMNNIVVGPWPIQNGGQNSRVAGNIQSPTDPRFANAATFDFRLVAGSPAIDQGVALSPSITVDIRNRPRVGRADIGAYEADTIGTTPAPPSNLRIRKVS